MVFIKGKELHSAGWQLTAQLDVADGRGQYRPGWAVAPFLLQKREAGPFLPLPSLHPLRVTVETLKVGWQNSAFQAMASQFLKNSPADR